MKPKQVGEQHRLLFSPEKNYQHRWVARKKNKQEKERAEKEIESFLKEEDDDREGI